MDFVKQVIVCLVTLSVTTGTGHTQPLPTIMNQTETYSQPGKTIKTEIGSEFIIALDSNPTTGYSWDFADEFDPTILTLLNARFQPPETQLKGAGGTQYWTFRTIKKGKTGISLKYFRSWKKDMPPAREVVFTVIVRDSDR